MLSTHAIPVLFSWGTRPGIFLGIWQNMGYCAGSLICFCTSIFGKTTLLFKQIVPVYIPFSNVQGFKLLYIFAIELLSNYFIFAKVMSSQWYFIVISICICWTYTNVSSSVFMSFEYFSVVYVFLLIRVRSPPILSNHN